MKYKVTGKQNNSGMCFVCGTNNALGTHATFYECENETGEQVLLAVVDPKPEHQSYPNRMHGGVIAALLDETIGRAQSIGKENIWGVTIELTTRFRKPVPLDQTIYIEGKITGTNSRGFEGEGRILTADGTVCVTAAGKYLNVPIEKIAGTELGDDDWFMVEEELPKEIVINK